MDGMGDGKHAAHQQAAMDLNQGETGGCLKRRVKTG